MGEFMKNHANDNYDMKWPKTVVVNQMFIALFN